MNRHGLFQRACFLCMALMGAAAAASCMDWSSDIPCRSDLHCVDGFVCGPDGECIPEDEATADAGRPDGGNRDAGRAGRG